MEKCAGGWYRLVAESCSIEVGALARPEVTGFGASTVSKITTPQKAGGCWVLVTDSSKIALFKQKRSGCGPKCGKVEHVVACATPRSVPGIHITEHKLKVTVAQVYVCLTNWQLHSLFLSSSYCGSQVWSSQKCVSTLLKQENSRHVSLGSRKASARKWCTSGHCYMPLLANWPHMFSFQDPCHLHVSRMTPVLVMVGEMGR